MHYMQQNFASISVLCFAK